MIEINKSVLKKRKASKSDKLKYNNVIILRLKIIY